MPNTAWTCQQRYTDHAAAYYETRYAVHGRPAAFFVVLFTACCTNLLQAWHVSNHCRSKLWHRAQLNVPLPVPAGQDSLRSFKTRSCKEMPGRRASMHLL